MIRADYCLLVWRDERDCQIKEAMRLAHFIACGKEGNNYVELKRNDGSATRLRIVWRALPRNGGRALFLLCPWCETPRRFVYGWEWDSFSGWSNRVRRIGWRCRSCAQLRYSSEGGFLRPGRLFRAFGSPPRPALWLPYVFNSPEEAAHTLRYRSDCAVPFLRFKENKKLPPKMPLW